MQKPCLNEKEIDSDDESADAYDNQVPSEINGRKLVAVDFGEEKGELDENSQN
jgi:hypothetical protein